MGPAGLTFLTPLGALLGAAAALPLWALLSLAFRARRVRAALGLPEPPPSSRLLAILCLLALAGLLALAATQPVISRTKTTRIRTDAEAFFVFDVSRSMLARQELAAPTRLERAKAAGERLRAALGDVPVGIASMTDRTLPHLFPTAHAGVFSATLARSVAIEQPPPISATRQATSLSALATVPGGGFFSPSARRRLLIVFTDGESRPFNEPAIAAVLRRARAPSVVFVHVWSAQDEVFSRGSPEAAYEPDPASAATLEELAASIGGRAFTEASVGAAARSARDLLGRGPTVAQGVRDSRTALAPYLAAAALVPLSFLLWRRSV